MTAARVSDLSVGTLRSGHGVRFLSLCLLALALPGCAKKADRTAAPEAAGGVPDDIAALEQELAAREQQLAYQGVPVAATPALAGGAGGGEGAKARAQDHERKTAEDAGADATEAQTAAAPTSAPPEPAPMRDAPQDRCTTVCELSAAICQLEDRICGLAPRHPGEPRYQAACERATRDCQMSQEACHACA